MSVFLTAVLVLFQNRKFRDMTVSLVSFAIDMTLRVYEIFGFTAHCTISQTISLQHDMWCNFTVLVCKYVFSHASFSFSGPRMFRIFVDYNYIKNFFSYQMQWPLLIISAFPTFSYVPFSTSVKSFIASNRTLIVSVNHGNEIHSSKRYRFFILR